jgi:hypothetical protein
LSRTAKKNAKTFLNSGFRFAAVQTVCSEPSYSGASIIFIEKRISFPPSLQPAAHVAISQSDMQCFSHEDGCIAAGTEIQKQLA